MIEYLGGIAIAAAVIGGSGVLWARWDKKKEDERIAETNRELQRMQNEAAKRHAAQKRKTMKKPEPVPPANEYGDYGGLQVSVDDKPNYYGPRSVK